MSDLDERLRGIDRLSPPDLWWDAQRRAVGRRASGRDHARRLVTIVVSLVIGLAGVAVLVVAFDPDERTPTAPVDERIVFSSIIFPNNPGQIFSMAPDGTDLVRLTSDLASYSSVSISPDDSRMAYVRLGESGSDGGWGPEGIYVANGDGTKAREIFRSAERPQSIADLAWSPDGQTIGFVLRSIPPGASSEGEWTSRLWVVAADGSDPHPVSDEQITSFSWSPVGDQFVVTRESLDGVRFVDDIFVMGADGSSVARLTSQGESRDPIWSPNGRRILYAEGFAPGGPRAMVMLADGSDAAPLPVDSRGWTEPLAWSVDSNQVLLSAGNAQNGCSMLVVALSGGTTVLLRGGEPVYSSSPGETPSASGAACVESASWVGSGRN